MCAMTLTSCLDGDDSGGAYQQVFPGMQIANLSRMQQTISAQPLDKAVRLAMLLDEAQKQQNASGGALPALADVAVNGRKVLPILFGNGATIEAREGGDYRITFGEDYFCKGSLTVHTQEVALSETNAETPWSVTLDPNFQIQTSEATSVDLVGNDFRIYREIAASYRLEFNGVDGAYSGSSVHSDWSGSFRMTLPAEELSFAYSNCAGKKFGYSGRAEGVSLYTFDNATGVRMVYEMKSGEYSNYARILSGTEECSFVGTYPNYPSSSVRVVYELSPNGQVQQTVYYNNYTWSGKS